MKTLALVFAVFALWLVVTPAYAQQSAYALPNDGNGMLEFCGHTVDGLDSPSSQTGADFTLIFFKEGWCAGHLQTVREMISYMQFRVVQTVAFLNGQTNPTEEGLTKVISKNSEMTCIPTRVNGAQMARVLVKWLRDHPERLHESVSVLSVDAFHSAFPCQEGTATKKPAAK